MGQATPQKPKEQKGGQVIMSRQVKYRVWDKPFNNWMDHCASLMANGTMLYISITLEDGNKPTPSIFNVDSERYIIQQFTGLQDRNGKEIYEGDVVSLDYGNLKGSKQLAVVVWSMNGFYLQHPKFPKALFEDTTYQFEECKVMGNVIQHPELLD